MDSLLDKLNDIADTLARVNGDTDPEFEKEFTDWEGEDIQDEYPAWWAERELRGLVRSHRDILDGIPVKGE